MGKSTINGHFNSYVKLPEGRGNKKWWLITVLPTQMAINGYTAYSWTDGWWPLLFCSIGSWLHTSHGCFILCSRFCKTHCWVLLILPLGSIIIFGKLVTHRHTHTDTHTQTHTQTHIHTHIYSYIEVVKYTHIICNIYYTLGMYNIYIYVHLLSILCYYIIVYCII